MKPRPPLSQSFANALKYSAEQRGWLAFFPYAFLACVGLGAAAAWSVPHDFWSAESQNTSTTVYGGILAFNAILLAVSGSAFTKIYEIITGPALGPTLKKHDLIDEHLAFVDLNQLVLVLAALVSLAGLVTLLLPALLWVERSLLAGTLSLSAYSLLRTLSSTRMMHELIWEQAHADELPNKPTHLRPVGNGK